MNEFQWITDIPSLPSDKYLYVWDENINWFVKPTRLTLEVLEFINSKFGLVVRVKETKGKETRNVWVRYDEFVDNINKGVYKPI